MERFPRSTQHLAIGLALFLCVGCSGGPRELRAPTAAEEQFTHSRPTPESIPTAVGMKSVGARVRINAPPSAVWSAYAVGFGNISTWANDSIGSSHCSSGDSGELGAVRSCTISEQSTFAGGDLFEERILRWDPERGYFAIVLTATTAPVEMLINENWINSDGEGGTVVTSISQVDLAFPLTVMPVSSRFKKILVGQLVGLKHYVETGESVSAENREELIAMYQKTYKDNGL